MTEERLIDSIGYLGGKKMADTKTGIVLLRPGRVMIGEGQWERSLKGAWTRQPKKLEPSWSRWVIKQCLQGHTREQETGI